MFKRHKRALNIKERHRLIGEKLRLERLKYRRTQGDISNSIAARYGEAHAISQTRISNIENGKASYVDVVELEMIAEAIHLTVPQILN